MSQTPNEKQYIISTLRAMVGLAKSEENLLPFPPQELIDLLLRKEEWKESKRDQWGNWEHTYSKNYQRGKLWEPELDLWVKDVRRDLLAQGIDLIPTWPDDAPFSVCLTHDVDILSDTVSIKQGLRKLKQFWCSEDQKDVFVKIKRTLGLLKNKYSIYPSIEKTIGTLHAIEKEYHVPSTYFLFASPLHRISQHDCMYSLNDRVRYSGDTCSLGEVFQKIHSDGYEMGLHGSYYTATTPQLLASQKQQLENALDLPVTSTRQHFLHWEQKVTPKLQTEANILVDGTLGYNRNIGFRSGTCYPFYFFDKDSDTMIPLLEIPLVVQDGALFGNNALELDPVQAFSVTKQLIDSVRSVGGCMTILIHPDMMLLDGVSTYYRQVIEYCLKHKAWFTTMSGMANWWKQKL